MPDHADVFSTCAVDRNDGFNAHLIFVTDPEHTGIDGSGGNRSGIDRMSDRRFHLTFHNRNQMVEKVRKTEVRH